MKPWVDLYRAHRELRSGMGRNVENDIRQVIRTLSQQRPIFDGHAHQRFNPIDRDGHLRNVGLGPQGQGEPLRIARLPANERREVGLKEAHLTLQILLDPRIQHLHMLTVMVECRREDDTAWMIAVHLPDDRKTVPGEDRQGFGGCSHAALHCHVGPNFAASPKVRVPLPALSPPNIVEWVLSQVVPIAHFEPAPWPRVLDALAPPPDR